MNTLLRSWTLLVALGLVAGCAEEKKAQTVEGDAGAEQGPQKPTLDAKLGAAVKAAESQQAAPGKGGGDGPPESGVFAPGMADKAQPPGVPVKVELLGEGAAPRVQLAPAPADEQKASANVTLRIQGLVLPVDYALTLKVDKPKDEKKDDKKADGPRSFRVVGKVASVSTSPQLPRDLADTLGKLKGSEIRYTIGPSGGAGELGFTLPKEVDPALGEAMVKGLVDAVSVSVPPLPPKPVGVGAYWMVTDRSSTLGIDVVRYRVYKVEKIDKDTATLSVDVRQYAAKEDADLGALAKGQKLTIQRFESSGKGKVEWMAAGLFPAHSETSQRLGIAAGVAGGQQAMLQAETSAKLGVEDKKK